MNTSLRTADQITHLKIVVVSLMAAIVVVMVGITRTLPTQDPRPSRSKWIALLSRSAIPQA